MLNDPVLLIPAFRSGRETPWAGDALRHEYEKYTFGNMIGESYDFSILKNLESSLPNGMPLSEHLKKLNIAKESLPFLIKWTDADAVTSLHVHPYDEFLYIVKAKKDAALICGIGDEVCGNHTEIAHFCAGDVIQIPASLPHALRGLTCYQIQPPLQASYRLYDWDRMNNRGQRRMLQTEKAHAIMSSVDAKLILPENNVLIDTDAFQLIDLAEADNHSIAFEGRFSVLTCLESAVMNLSSGKALYLSKGQSVFIPHSDHPCTLSGRHCL